MTDQITKGQFYDMFKQVIDSPIGQYIGQYIGDYDTYGKFTIQQWPNIYLIQNSHGFIERRGSKWYGVYKTYRDGIYDINMWYCYSHNNIWRYYLLSFEMNTNNKYRLVDVKIYIDNELDKDVYTSEMRYNIINDNLVPPDIHYNSHQNTIVDWVNNEIKNGNIIGVGLDCLLKQDKYRSELRILCKNNHFHIGTLIVYGYNTIRNYVFNYRSDDEGVSDDYTVNSMNDTSFQIYQKLKINTQYFIQQYLRKITFISLNVRYELTLSPDRNIEEIRISPPSSSSTNSKNSNLTQIININSTGHITSNEGYTLSELLSLW